jgi:hypothetical protein
MRRYTPDTIQCARHAKRERRQPRLWLCVLSGSRPGYVASIACDYALALTRRHTATAALNAMNGMQLGSKPIIVRLHEPKQFRQEKLALRFQGNGHPRSASGTTSPTRSEAGDSSFGWTSPRRQHSVLGSPSPSHQHLLLDRGRRSSGSYYQVSCSFTPFKPYSDA